jgi:two-component system chemotaxis sensor kinase CheA
LRVAREVASCVESIGFMDDLLREFLTETGESLDLFDAELVRFEKGPGNAQALQNLFRVVHTIKGACGFLGLSRLEALTHAAETLLSGFRAGRPVTRDAVSLILVTVDRVKSLLHALETDAREPEGNDADLISALQGIAAEVAPTARALGAPERYSPRRSTLPSATASPEHPPRPPDFTPSSWR